MCRKLETEEEKILPFYASSLTEQEEMSVMNALYDTPGEKLAEVFNKKKTYYLIFFSFNTKIYFPLR